MATLGVRFWLDFISKNNLSDCSEFALNNYGYTQTAVDSGRLVIQQQLINIS